METPIEARDARDARALLCNKAETSGVSCFSMGKAATRANLTMTLNTSLQVSRSVVLTVGGRARG